MARSLLLRALLPLAGLVLILGCQGPAAPGNGIVAVANLGRENVSFRWQQSGLFGRSREEAVEPCREYALGFGPGRVEFTVTSNSASRTFILDAPAQGSRSMGVVIGSDGSIEESPPDQPFPTPCVLKSTAPS